MTDELAIGDVLFRQSCLDSTAKIARSYDLVIAGLSWEARGTVALSRLSKTDAAVVLLKFKSRSSEVEVFKVAQLDNYRKILTNVSVKELEPSISTAENFQMLKAWIQDNYAQVGRPLSVLIDITCLPKTYMLYLLGLGFREELVARMDYLYTPGKYDLISSGVSTTPVITGPRSIISEGEWHSRQIPYLEASEYIANDLDLLVTLGGELGLSLPFIERFEPRRLGLVFIDETSPGKGTPMLVSERMAYEELLREPNVMQKDVSLCDALGMVRHALAFVDASVARGTTMMAIGAKPHALALGLAALADSRIEVVCRTPASYRVVDVQPSGQPMFYEIEDRFDPASYI